MDQLLTSFRETMTEMPGLSTSKLLLALSGGVDSMVLADLLIQSGLKFSVAHCNFQLRGKASDGDCSFIEEFCKENQIDFFIKKFDVQGYQKTGNYSIQMAARNLRYDWFDELIQQYQFDFLLTAHQLDDSIETFLINLSRGTGIEGLTGIKKQKGKILRPLLPFSKNEILDYAEKNNVKWREDDSNNSDDYLRNKIRHRIIPVLKEINPNFAKSFTKSLNYLESDFELIRFQIEKIKKKTFVNQGDEILIKISELKEEGFSNAHLFHLFNDFGFKFPLEIKKLMNSNQNGEIISKTHRLIKNREELILTSLKINVKDIEILLNPNEIIQKPLYLKLEKSDTRDLNADESLDFDLIKFPVRLRKITASDEFRPLGMKGKKKLSKYFKDEKYSKTEKEKAWVLVSNENEILYILNRRIDERFKITEHTQNYLNIYLC